MAGPYANLQKKLLELESDLLRLFNLSPNSPYRQPLSDDIHQRFLFLNKRFIAETASGPLSHPHQIDHLLARFQADFQSFHDWLHRTTSALDPPFDATSQCFCTESCLKDGDEGWLTDVGSPVHHEEAQSNFSDPVVEEKEQMEAAAITTEGSGREERRVEAWVKKWFWKNCAVLGGGMAVGAAVMGFVMVRLSGCFCEMKLQGGLIPT